MTKIILTDIEGTTSSIHFVKEVLFPYAAARLADYVHLNQSDSQVQRILANTSELLAQEGRSIDANDLDALIAVLLNWIDIDKKATPLKELQGLIWQEGYEQGAYKAHLYADAGRMLLQWYLRDIPLYVYSSGSVAAQKLFFAHNEAGNLLPLFSGFFDTQMGAKQEVRSYQNILAALQQQHEVEAQEILFLSDIEGELNAAQQAGFATYWLIREGEQPTTSQHPVAKSFSEIQL